MSKVQARRALHGGRGQGLGQLGQDLERLGVAIGVGMDLLPGFLCFLLFVRRSHVDHAALFWSINYNFLTLPRTLTLPLSRTCLLPLP